LPPRSSVADYPAHDAPLGAAIVPASQVSKVFTSAIAKDYVVVEVAVFPENASSVDLAALDFALNFDADSRGYPATPEEAAWHGRQPPTIMSQGPRVVSEVGVSVGTRTDPVTGRAEHGAATYGGIGVDNRPLSPTTAPPGTPADDPNAVEGRLRRMAFPADWADRPIAGYLYFPKAASPKNSVKKATSLEYSWGGLRKVLPLPLK
jgi:hypothetical protein